jgi:hypothetical protein
MSIRAALERILKEWSVSRTETFAQNSLAIHIRQGAAEEVEKALVNPTGLTVKGSAGAGQWAAVPWIAVYDDVITDSATHGYYVVYLFHTTEPIVHLSLNQGTTDTRSEFKNATHGILQDRAQLIRRRLPDFALQLPITSIDLGSGSGLPGDYAAGHTMGISSVGFLRYRVEAASERKGFVCGDCGLKGHWPVPHRTASSKLNSAEPVGSGTLIERRRYTKCTAGLNETVKRQGQQKRITVRNVKRASSIFTFDTATSETVSLKPIILNRFLP